MIKKGNGTQEAQEAQERNKQHKRYGLLVSFLCLLCFLCSGPRSPASAQNRAPRVVAIGDIHGDLDAFAGILQRTRLTDPSRRWAGGNSILVQTGDFLDRGPEARAVMDLLMSLQKDAPRHGGINPDLAASSIDQLNDAIAGEIKAFDSYKQYIIEKKIAQPCATLDELTAAARAALDKAKGKDAETLKAFLGYGSWLSINEN